MAQKRKKRSSKKMHWFFLLLLLVIILIILYKPELLQEVMHTETTEPQVTQQTAQLADPIDICSFNIQFLGNSKKRDNAALTSILKDYDIVVVQELVAPPVDGTFPDGSTYSADPQAAEFFINMQHLGFHYVLSEEDTGTKDKIHVNSSSTEWWITFYKEQAVEPAADLPHGFLAADHSNHPDWERVPYAFAFRAADGGADFVLISVHLMPGDGTKDRERRVHELAAISDWIDANNSVEKDFIILGDMNLYTPAEVTAVTPTGYLSLNDECRTTNSLTVNGKGKPYDHVMYNIEYTTHEIDTDFDLQVIDLVAAMRPTWTSSEPYPGAPYDHNAFRSYYSDHFPVHFRIKANIGDDD